MELQERVSQWFIAQKKTGVTQTHIAKRWGVSVQYISSLKKGNESIGIDVIKRILNIDKKINLRWLILGEGKMYLHNYDTLNIVGKDIHSNLFNEAESLYNSNITDLIETNRMLVKSVVELQEEIRRFLTKETKATKATKDN